MKGAKLLFR